MSHSLPTSGLGDQVLVAIVAENQQMRQFMQQFMHTWEERMEGKLEKFLCRVADRQLQDTLSFARNQPPRKAKGSMESNSSNNTDEAAEAMDEQQTYQAKLEHSAFEIIGKLGDLALRQTSQLERIQAMLESMPAKVVDAMEKHPLGEFWSEDEQPALGEYRRFAGVPEGLSLDSDSIDDIKLHIPKGLEEQQQDAGAAFTPKSTMSPDRTMKRAAQKMTDLYRKGEDITDIIHRLSITSKTEQEVSNEFQRTCVDRVSVLLIVLNTIYMAFETETRMDCVISGKEFPGWLLWGNVAFAVAFGLELISKIMIFRRDFFFGDAPGWNIFDAVLVLCSIADVVFEFLNISFLRNLRVIRAVRATRALQTIHHVQQLRLMVASIISSLPSLFWAFSLLMLLVYLYALLIMQGVEAHFSMHGLDPDLLSMYGKMHRSILSLFMAISGGKDWGECAEPLAQVSPVYVIVFVIFVTFVVFGVVNILTAVFIEASSRIIDVDRDLVVQRYRSQQEGTVRLLQKLFEQFDTQKTGTISHEQFHDLFKNKECVALLQTLGLETDQWDDFVNLLDMDGDQLVNIGEFVVGLMRVRGVAKGTDVATVLKENKRLYKALQKEFRHLQKAVDQLNSRVSEVSGCLDRATSGPLLDRGGRSGFFSERRRSPFVSQAAGSTETLPRPLPISQADIEYE